MTGWLWLLMGVAGLTAFGATLYLAQYKTTHPPHTPDEDRHLNAATRELYSEVEHDRSIRSE